MRDRPRRARCLRRALTFEPLERRHLLAGNITAFLAGDDLLIFGDSQPNGLLIQQVGLHTYELSGGPDLVDYEMTQVNGQASIQFTVPGSLRLFLAGGADFLVLDSVQIPRDLFIDAGSGDDLLLLRSIAARNVNVQGSGGIDTLEITAAQVDQLLAQLGAADDKLFLSDITSSRAPWYDGGDGLDYIAQLTHPTRSPVVSHFEFDVIREELTESLHFMLAVGESAQAETTEQHSLVTDFHVALDSRGRPQVTPVLTNVATGLIATAKIDAISAGGWYVTVAVDATFTHLDDVLQYPVPLPGGSRLLQQPVVSTTSVSTAVSIPDGGTVFAGGNQLVRSRAEGLEYLPPTDDSYPLEISIDPSVPLKRGELRLGGELILMLTPRIIDRAQPGNPPDPAVDLELQAVYHREKVVPRPNSRTQGDDARLNQLDVLKLMLINGETRSVSRKVTQPMLTNYDTTLRRNAKATVDPVVTDVETGMSLTATATMTLDRRFVTLDLDLLHTGLKDVVAHAIQGPFGKAQIQLPTLVDTRLQSRVQIPDGGFVLIGEIRAGNDVYLALATPRIILQEEEEIVSEGIVQARGERQVSLEILFSRVTSDEPMRQGITLTATDELEARGEFTVHEPFITDFATTNLPGGSRIVRPVVSIVDHGRAAAETANIFADRRGADFQVHYVGNTIAKVRTATVSTPLGRNLVRRPELATFDSDFPISIFDSETVTVGPLVDSRGKRLRLNLTNRIIIAEEEGPDTDFFGYRNGATLQIDLIL